jgi:hypothetical protein
MRGNDYESRLVRDFAKTVMDSGNHERVGGVTTSLPYRANLITVSIRSGANLI